MAAVPSRHRAGHVPPLDPRSWRLCPFLLFLGLGGGTTAFGQKRRARFSNVFQSHMVLQRGRPIEIWGFDAEAGSALAIELSHDPGGGKEWRSLSWSSAFATSSGGWRANLGVQPPEVTGKALQITLSKGNARLQTLKDVVLGDVYVFSGQSNVDLPVTYVHQFDPQAQEHEERIASLIGEAGLLRLMIVPARCGLTYKSTYSRRELAEVGECLPCPPPFGPQKPINKCNLLGQRRALHSNYSYCNCDSLQWSRATGANVRGFSATAWFTGKSLLSLDILRGVPIGLMRVSWGATNIAVWSGPGAVAKCPQRGHVPFSFAPDIASALYHNMINPLIGLQFSAIVWVHGARNVGPPNEPYLGGEYYSCALRAMITGWREGFGQASLPFLVVEMPVYCNDHDYDTWHTWCDDKKSRLRGPDRHLPEMRWAQNQAEELDDVYVVSTMDEGDLAKVMGGGVHSMRKPELSTRIVLAARRGVYKDTCAIWTGPKAVSAWQVGGGQVWVCFDTHGGGDLFLNKTVGCPAPVLPVYCTGAGFELFVGGKWAAAHGVSLRDQRLVIDAPNLGKEVERVRYAFADWPVSSLMSASGMPARMFNLAVHGKDVSGEACPAVPVGSGDGVPGCTTVTTTTITTTATTTISTTTVTGSTTSTTNASGVTAVVLRTDGADTDAAEDADGAASGATGAGGTVAVQTSAPSVPIVPILALLAVLASLFAVAALFVQRATARKPQAPLPLLLASPRISDMEGLEPCPESGDGSEGLISRDNSRIDSGTFHDASHHKGLYTELWHEAGGDATADSPEPKKGTAQAWRWWGRRSPDRNGRAQARHEADEGPGEARAFEAHARGEPTFSRKGLVKI